jgi:hypothetical protein
LISKAADSPPKDDSKGDLKDHYHNSCAAKIRLFCNPATRIADENIAFIKYWGEWCRLSNKAKELM